MRLKNYHPNSKLVVPQHFIEKPRFPVIDAHNHLGEFGGKWTQRPTSELLATLDECGVQGYVDLDGGWGEQILEEHLDKFKAAAPDRFQVFGGVDFTKWAEKGAGFIDWAVSRLHAQAQRGAQGLKLWKNLGLSVKDEKGKLVSIDDGRLDPIWQACAELKLPILIHSADPVAFFDRINETNERWEELGANPDWAFTSPPGPTFLSLVEGLAQVITRHPQTTFIGAHVGCYPENLGWVSALLDRCPNFYVDISARIAELGRQPYTSRRFFLRHADRILFGLDSNPSPARYQISYRFLETADEYFPYWTDRPGQGRWHIYGIDLPDDVLRRVYYANAVRLLGFPNPEPNA